MDDTSLFIDLFKRIPRQGPGSDAQTMRALELSGLAGRGGLRIADIGCGSGASTLVLARELDARIAAVDHAPELLALLDAAAAGASLKGRIETLDAPMEDLPFADGSLDAIWAEGSIYNIGFEAGLTAWRRFLKPGGVLAVSELTWLTATRPEEIEAYWHGAYPGIATASAKIAQLEAGGYAPIGNFPLTSDCWLESYYLPMQREFDDFLERHGQSEPARAIVAALREEIEIYRRFSDYFGYGLYLARKSAA